MNKLDDLMIEMSHNGEPTEAELATEDLRSMLDYVEANLEIFQDKYIILREALDRVEDMSGKGYVESLDRDDINTIARDALLKAKGKEI